MEYAITSGSAELTRVRSRGVRFLGYLFWIGATGFVLIASNAYLAAVERWLGLVERARHALGATAPQASPDWFWLAGFSVAILIPVLLACLIYARYRVTWKRRLETVWGPQGVPRRFTRVDAPKTEYLRALLNAPAWRERVIPENPEPEDYRRHAVLVLSDLETDIAARALTLGLIIGIGRHRVLDLVTIGAAALEMQLHVLTRLGKWPNARTWAELWKRTTASLFLNSYLNREEAWEIALAVKKASLGLDFVANATDQAVQQLEGIDLEQYLNDVLPNDPVSHLLKNALPTALGTLGVGMGVGAAGVHQVASLVDRYGEELLEGILAGGIVYYHGMAIAADCLALDAQHRESPEMNRTARQAVTNVCISAGRLVRNQARELRSALKQRRRQMAKSVSKAAVERVTGAGGRLWEGVKAKVQREPTRE